MKLLQLSLIFVMLWAEILSDEILILGGNGMIGSETAHQLLEAGHNLTLVNRGTNFWDYQQRIAPRVKTITCDRRNGLSSCSDLVSWLKDKQFKAVVDFTGIEQKHMKDPMSLLTPHTRLYVYISAAVVYEVCEPKRHGDNIREEDAVRPRDPDKNKTLSESNSYGHSKLQCEEELIQAQAQQKNFDYIIFRLPDVIGPRDNTNRWWVYQFWLRMRKIIDIPAYIPEKSRGIEQSFVYLADVGRAVLAALNAPLEGRNQIYNLGWEEGRSTEDVLREVAVELGEVEKDYPLISYTDKKTAPDFFPTVTRGPLSTSKAVKTLGITFTLWAKAVHETVNFYEQVMKNGNPLEMQRNHFIFFMVSHVTKEKEEAFHQGLKQVYNIDAQASDKKSHANNTAEDGNAAENKENKGDNINMPSKTNSEEKEEL